VKRDPVILIVAALVISVMLIFGIQKARHSSGPGGTSAKLQGQLAPDFALASLDGKTLKLSDYRGKAVLLNFWATWCEPCKIEIPWLIEMQNKYGAKGFTVLGVAMDDDGSSVVAPFVQAKRYDVNGQKLAMNYPVVIGSDKVADKFGGLFGFPTSILISKDGKQIKRITGLISYDEINKLIEGQL